MKVLIIAGGDFLPPNELTNDCYVICADSGYDRALEHGISVNMLVGDMDSVKSDYKSIQNILVYPSRKDFTDTEIAVEQAVSMGAGEVILTGCIGSRIDHSLANIMLLKTISAKGIKASILYDDNYIYFYENYIRLDNMKGKTVSLIPISQSIDNIYTEGLDYSLSGESLFFGETRGVSNIIVGNEASYKSDNGFGVVVVTDGK